MGEIQACAPTPAVFFFALLLIYSVHSFYLPGIAPRDFKTGEPLSVQVNKLSSMKTQLPYDYYYLDYWKPKAIENSAENLGEVLRGDRMENSRYSFKMREEHSCTIIVCKLDLNPKSAKNFKEKIDDVYQVNMILYNLPVVVVRQRRDGQGTAYDNGFLVGFKGNYAGLTSDCYF